MERLVGLRVSIPRFFFVSPRRPPRLGKALPQLRGGTGPPGERLPGGSCPAEGTAEPPPGRAQPRAVPSPGPCPAGVRTPPPRGGRRSGFVRCCFRQMKRRSAGPGDARIHKRAGFDLFSLSPSWNRFSPSHIPPEGILLALLQRKMVLKKKKKKINLPTLAHGPSASGSPSLPSQAWALTLPERKVQLPSTVPRRGTPPTPAGDLVPSRRTPARPPRRELSRGVKNPPLRVGNLPMTSRRIGGSTANSPGK